MIKTIKKENGITLIALVVTVIVMLILASASIAVLVAWDSIIENAQKAKEDTERTELEETIRIAIINAIANDTLGEVKIDLLETELEIQGITGATLTTTSYSGTDAILLKISEGNEYIILKDGTLVK